MAEKNLEKIKFLTAELSKSKEMMAVEREILASMLENVCILISSPRINKTAILEEIKNVISRLKN